MVVVELHGLAQCLCLKMFLRMRADLDSRASSNMKR